MQQTLVHKSKKARSAEENNQELSQTLEKLNVIGREFIRGEDGAAGKMANFVDRYYQDLLRDKREEVLAIRRSVKYWEQRNNRLMHTD